MKNSRKLIGLIILGAFGLFSLLVDLNYNQGVAQAQYFGNKIPCETDCIINPSPLKQHESGTKWYEIQCNNDFVIVINRNSKPACVGFETAVKLYKRDWARNMEIDVWNTMAVNSAKEYFHEHFSQQFNVTSEPTFGLTMTVETLPPFVTVSSKFTSENGTNYLLLITVTQQEKIHENYK